MTCPPIFLRGSVQILPHVDKKSGMNDEQFFSNARHLKPEPVSATTGSNLKKVSALCRPATISLSGSTS